MGAIRGRGQVELDDGRRLDIRVTGPEDGRVLVFHHGTPGAAVREQLLETPAYELGLRVVSWSRPGYGDSTRQPHRRIVDVVSDAQAVLDALGVESCLVAGATGGSPLALACAARLPAADAALVVSPVAPFDADGLNWLAGLGEDNAIATGHALVGEDSLREYLASERDVMLAVTAAQVIESLSTLLPEVDRAELTGALAEDIIAGLHEGLRTGVDGWLDDSLSLIRPWGFDLEEIDIPTMIWHGSVDSLSPPAHGRWLTEHVPDTTGHVLDGMGHLSLWATQVPAMLDELLHAVPARG